MIWRRKLKYTLQAILLFLIFNFLVGPSTLPINDPISDIRAFTRPVEFNYVSWTIDAIVIKASQMSLNAVDFLNLEAQRQVVLDYLALVESIQRAEGQLYLVLGDPNLDDAESTAAELRDELKDLYAQRAQLGPLAESVIQNMVAATTSEMGFNIGDQAFPPVLYRSTPLPWALIVSPRDEIRQYAHISLDTDLTIDDHIILEDQISTSLDYSTLVVPVGGIGTYPTMVSQTRNLNWLVEVVSHEWIHNYLTIKPLGLRYGGSPELRTMNETTASIAGTEIGKAVIIKFFPEFAPPPPPESEEDEEETQPPPPPDDPPAFDFRAEMFETRVTVDTLLEEGKIEEAETYMEERRLFLWEHGYRIRKLNQAYFAFYGAYADVAYGAAGADPVGAAVRDLRAQSDSLIKFVSSIARLTSFEDLLDLLRETTIP